MRRLAVIFTLLVLTAAFAAAAPSITFDGKQVVVKGVTPGGDVACVGVWRELGDTMPRLVRWDRVVRDDGDGAVTFDVGRDVPPFSVWAVADVTTGDTDIVPGPGTDPRPAAFASDLVGSKRDGTFAFADRRAYLELLVVRPGTGAWAISAGDGGAGDDDKTPDGVIVPALAQSHPVTSISTRPAALSAGDVILAIDPESFEYYSVRLGRAK